MNLFQNKLMCCSHALKKGKKLNKGPILFIFKFDLGITRSLPTHIADMSMGFVAESLDASIWKETEGWRRAWVSIVCSSLRIRSPVWWPLRRTTSILTVRQEVAAHKHSRRAPILWTAATSPFHHWAETSGSERHVASHVHLCGLLF